MKNKNKSNLSEKFLSVLEILGFRSELNTNLFLVAALNQHKENPVLWFHLEKAHHLNATAVFFRRTLDGRGELSPQVYIYDFTDSIYTDSFKPILTDIHRKIWSCGEVPLTCLLFSTEIKILDCTVPINSINEEPVYLMERILLAGEAQNYYNNQFANRIKSGVFWDEENNQRKFNFNNSAYDKLILHLREKVIKNFIGQDNIKNRDIIHKLIIQSILIKYLEERKSIENGKITKVFEDNFFGKFEGAKSFCDVLRNGNFFNLCDELNQKDKFNGKIFSWTINEKSKLTDSDLNSLADALDGNSDVHGQLYFWRQYDFNYVPVELISRLYEEFIIIYEEERGKNGKVYTPAHLAKFLVDESIPLANYKGTSNFKILDPACGSGIFLVIAFRRLVQWWRLNHDFKRPSSKELKNILSDSIFGIDKDKKAIQLTGFSLCLALCDELSPKEIWDDLQFDDLIGTNLFPNDFFDWKNEQRNNSLKFDLIIGNPPFVRGGVKPQSGFWELHNEKIQIPQNQIALRFLAESTGLLKNGGLTCLIIKASGLLYNSTSVEFRKLLFSNFNIKQILDFTPLGRNNCLWDGSADVAAAAIFLKREQPDNASNILHAIFRRTKASKERIIFEIDDYDLHFVTRQASIENPFIWKINLLGGGRIKNIIEKCLDYQNLEQYLIENECDANEGFIKGTNGIIPPTFMNTMQYIPTEDFNEDGIDFSNLSNIKHNETFVKVPNQLVFNCPNILIKENVGKNRIPVFFNEHRSFSFKDKIVGIYSKNKDVLVLKNIFNSFSENNSLYRFFIFCTSSQVLVNLNSAILKDDLMRLPVLSIQEFTKVFSEIDIKIISDVNNHMQKFLRNGENSDIVKPISYQDNTLLINYGNEFSDVLNLIYTDGDKKFRMSNVIRFNDNRFIGTIFSYDTKVQEPLILNYDYDVHNLEVLSEFNINSPLVAKRILKFYGKNKVVFIKPNQKRYWLSLIAYRDADKTFSDLSNLGF